MALTILGMRWTKCRGEVFRPPLTNNGTTVGSTNGNVNIVASKTYTQTGSNVMTPEGDIPIAAMKGAIAGGKQVIADVGGDLTIESVQDKSQYDSKQ